MHSPIRQDILDFALHTITLVRPIASAIARHDKDLAIQLRGSASSFSLNVAEGFGTQKGSERVRFETALGSIYETENNVRLAVAWGYVAAEEAAGALAALHRLGGRVYGLTR